MTLLIPQLLPASPHHLRLASHQQQLVTLLLCFQAALKYILL